MKTAISEARETPHRPVFVLTIDAEEEWDWNGDFPRAPFSTRNIDQLPAFQRLCGEIGIRPTYFVDHAVVDDPAHAASLKGFLDRDECDIGAHLHPWCTPPVEETLGERESHAINLPRSLFERKLDTLTERLTSAFGRHPYSYRAGRWGMNGTHLRLLAQAGYRVDSSIRPCYSDRYFAYGRVGNSPYWPAFDDAPEFEGEQRDILEVPVSGGFDRMVSERLRRVHATLSAPPFDRMPLAAVLRRLGQVRSITVTPEGNDGADLRRCIDVGIARGDWLVNMFFHSSDLLPGCTPYVRSEADKRRLLACVRDCVEHLREVHDACFLTVREIRKLMPGEREDA